ncbi:hypothetical protein P5P86_06220 [Nocardioides sp. BP30]|uniref:hypothetical protein n=1 Tax=Nocardioides sp. BP30 TaxID=3036374 RepID=UPI0024685C19|nr:hypothetical protein [Nocardioides sp. BP30]WGL53422.1 hypothetical protein P5P86_06220 [Nocardioides sp. BP30]
MSETRSFAARTWRTGVVTTIATLAVATATAGATTVSADAAQTQSTPASTSIAISVVRSSVVAGAGDTVRGQLTVPGASAAGRQVTLEAKTAGVDGFTPVGTATAGGGGALSVSVTPEVTTRYRWNYAGAADARPRLSGVALVKVRTTSHPARRLPATLSIRSVHHTVGFGGRDTIRGQLRSRGVALPHRSVVLQAHVPGTTGWQFRSTRSSNRHGKVSFSVHPQQRTAYRLFFLGSQVFRPAHSAVVRVAVRPTVTIAATPQRIDPGQTTTVSGTVSKAGTPLAGLTVDLLARKAHTHAAWKIAGTAVTAADGTVSLEATPAVDTSYRLRAHHATGVAAALSPVLSVVVSDPTSLSISGRHTGSTTVISGRLLGDHHALRGRTVVLESQAPGATAWTQAGSDRTARHGQVRFVEPTVTGTSYRLEFTGGGHFAPSTSATLAG